MISRSTFLVAVLSILGACTSAPALDGGDAAVQGGDGSQDANRHIDAAPTPDAGPLDQPQIVGVVHALHQSAIAEAQAVVTRAARADLRDSAQGSIDAHTAADAALLDAASAAGLAPAPSQTSAEIETSSTRSVAHLMDAGGIDVDLRYVGLAESRGSAYRQLRDLVPQVTDEDLATVVEDAGTLFYDEASELRDSPANFPEAGWDWDAGPPVDASFDVGVDA